MSLVRRIWALRAYRDTKAAIDRKDDVTGNPMVEVWNDVMHARMDRGDI
jgi:hypothetical protein